MNKVLTLIMALSFTFNIYGQGKSTALIIVDIQDFYFPGGSSELAEPVAAAKNAAIILEIFRNKQLEVVHIKHNYEPGGDINEIVVPIDDETIIIKDEVNGFLDTGLKEHLTELEIDTLVICGMQTHMCVEALVRAAHDMGFVVILIEDACTTKDLKYNDCVINYKEVHASTLSTLKNYARIITTEEFICDKKIK